MNEIRIEKIRLALQKLESKLGSRANLCAYAELNKDTVDALLDHSTIDQTWKLSLFESILFDTKIPDEVVKEQLGESLQVTGNAAQVLQRESVTTGKTPTELLVDRLESLAAESAKRHEQIRNLLRED